MAGCLRILSRSVIHVARQGLKNSTLQASSAAVTRPAGLSTTSCNNMPKMNVDGMNLNYVKVGTGPHIVLLMPGTLGSIESDFPLQLKGLSSEKFTMVSWDPPGFGSSIPPERDFSGNYLMRDAELVRKLMLELNMKQFSILGWSAGGMSAMMMAATYPETVKKLVVWGVRAFIDDEDAKQTAILRSIDTWTDDMRAPVIARYGEKYLRKTWDDWIASLDRMKASKDGNICREYLPKIVCPTLIFQGTRDIVAGVKHGKYVHENVKGSRLIIMEKAKHNLNTSRAEEFNKAVEEFLLEE